MGDGFSAIDEGRRTRVIAASGSRGEAGTAPAMRGRAAASRVPTPIRAAPMPGEKCCASSSRTPARCRQGGMNLQDAASNVGAASMSVAASAAGGLCANLEICATASRNDLTRKSAPASLP